MSSLIRLVVGIVLLYFIVTWALDNPQSASSILEWLEGAYKGAVEYLSENLFDNKGE